MAPQASSSSNTGLKIIGGLLGLGLFLALFSGGDPDNDAWAQGETDDTDGEDGDSADVPTGDPEDPWTAGPEYGGGDGDGDDGSGPPACDGSAWFATDGGAVLLPVAGSGTDGPTPSCQLGATSGGAADAVALVQQVLAACNGQAVAVDGAYGAQTRQAVSAVQADNGITADGIYGPQTSAVMAWPVEDPTGDVVGEDPIGDRPDCTGDAGTAPAADSGALPHTP